MKTEAESVAEIARRIEPTAEIVTMQGAAVPMIVHHNGKRRDVESLERFMPRPVRKRAAVTVRDHMSFIDYVTRHAEPGSTIFAEVKETGGSFTAVLDYHHANKSGEVALGDACFGEHVCVYVCEHTPEWKRWMERNGKGWTQIELAQFIEDNRLDIVAPDAATMLELVKSFEATSGVEFKSAVRLDNGDRTIHFAHTTNAKAGVTGELTIPDLFKLRLPVFMNGPAYDVDARFRYQLSDGRLVLRYEIVRPHKVIDLALQEARTAIVSGLNPIPCLLGAASIAKA